MLPWQYFRKLRVWTNILTVICVLFYACQVFQSSNPKKKPLVIRALSNIKRASLPLKYDANEDTLPTVTVAGVDCSKLFKGDQEEIHSAKGISSNLNNKPVLSMAKNCTDFIKTRRYANLRGTPEESAYPLAYSIVMYKDLDQVEMLLRAIYRPHNFYCIHVDRKVKAPIRKAMTAIAKCFPNVFLASVSEDVRWGFFSVVQAEINCMEDLIKAGKWTYFINLTGQEFPLKTNWELVRILKALNGSNVISGNIKGKNIRRTKWKYRGTKFQNRLLPPVPHNMTITKGPVHVIATRDFVKYVISDVRALVFRDWVRNSAVPDETFFSSLNHNPQLDVPGSFKGDPQMTPSNPHIQRLKGWAYKGQELGGCKGKLQRQMCILGVGDLPKMQNTRKLFVNKFHWDYERVALRCLEQRYFDKVKLEANGERSFDAGYYQQLDYTLNHVPTSLNKVN